MKTARVYVCPCASLFLCVCVFVSLCVCVCVPWYLFVLLATLECSDHVLVGLCGDSGGLGDPWGRRGGFEEPIVLLGAGGAGVLGGARSHHLEEQNASIKWTYYEKNTFPGIWRAFWDSGAANRIQTCSSLIWFW